MGPRRRRLGIRGIGIGSQITSSLARLAD
jgi:hypothetical protein